MRFSDDTADIPDRLIALQEKGEVVFLCGAGISQRYGLPSFYKLTTDIYTQLGESWTGHPAEEDAMGLNPDGTTKGPAALDRALFALSKRLRGTDTASRLRAERLIIQAIEAHLKAPQEVFTAHADVWTLSRDPEMRQRVVTTNFDTLFERVAAPDTSSRSGADLPPPLGTDFTGVLHLHGRIADKELGLPRTSLVLNSAEFGEAYLRSGWAARYVYDLARASTIVILGYGADDPPMRYILEVLTADRERYPDIREIFAFVPCAPDDTARDRVAAIWEAKGATAIVYDSRHSADHDTLYKSIANWAAFAADPTGWRRAAAAHILSQAPDTVGSGDWERLRWLLGGGDAGELLGEINPKPEWAAPLTKAEVFKAGGVSPFRWILKRLNDPEMPAAVAENLPISQEVLMGLERSLTWQNRTSKELHPVLLQAWRLIVQFAQQRGWLGQDIGLRWHHCMNAVEEGDFSFATKRDVLACLRPRISISHVFRWPGIESEPDETNLRLRNVLQVSWGPKSLDKIDALVARWPTAARSDLIRSLLHALEDALEEAQDTETLHAASGDVPSISAHGQNAYADGFYSIVRAIIDLWGAEVVDRPRDAKLTAQAWLGSPFLLAKRMGLYALLKPIFSSPDIADSVLGLSDEEFWLSDCRRETMQLFAHRWESMDADDRARVEARIVAGMPRALLVPDGDEDQIAIVRENAVFIRFARIEGAGQLLSDAAQRAMAELRAKHPEWASEGEQDDFRYWSSGVRTVGHQGDISVLADTQPENLLERVEQVAADNPFDQGDLWRLYCDAESANALIALKTSDPTSTIKSGAWQSFFWSITASEDVPIQTLALKAVLAPHFEFKPYTAIADWLLRKREALAIDTMQFLALWDRLFATIAEDGRPIEDQSRRDVVMSMLNSAEGKIGTVLLEEYERVRGDGHEADRAAILTRIETLVGTEEQLGFLGTAAAMDGVRVLYSEAPDWTTEHLLALTRWTSTFALAAWSVLLRRNVPRPDLFAAIKADLLEAGTHAELDRSVESVASWLIAPLLWAQPPNGPVPEITPVEVRRALARSVESVRSSAAYWLTSAIEQLPGEAADLWRDRIGPLFREIWPLEPQCRSSGATLHLVRLALRTGEAFPDAVDAIAPALGPLESWDIESWLGRDEDAKAYYDSAPAALLTLFDAVVSTDNVPPGLLAMLQRLAETDPALESDRRYLKLIGWARRQASR